MNLESWIATAAGEGASDLHLEAGLPAALRVRGALRVQGEAVPGRAIADWARQLLGEEAWAEFVVRRSHDLSRTLAGVRCRINVLQTARGTGLAVRLLTSFVATLDRLNFHPDLKRLVARENGLVLVCGPTGCGKSTTLAAMVEEINQAEVRRHVVTVESPIEYWFRPRRAYIRQREVGRDTPSFEQALLDALREDPDVLMVGEMREPATMRLTLNAAETGHLVLSTVHSGTCAEALQRVVSSFAPEIQGAVAAQVADCLVAVVAQRLQFRPDLKIRVPECEVLVATNPVKAQLRAREFFKLPATMETGAEQGMWTLARYRHWLERRTQWAQPAAGETLPEEAEVIERQSLPDEPPARRPVAGPGASPPAAPVVDAAGRRIEIEPVEGGLEGVLKRLGG